MTRAWAIPDELLERKDLDGNEKIMIAILDRLGALEHPVFPRQSWLAEKMGLTERGVRKILVRLENRGIVVKGAKKWKLNRYSLAGTECLLSPEQSTSDSEEQSASDKREYHSREKHKEIFAAEAAAKGAKKDSSEIVAIIDSFRKTGLAPALKFNNKTERAACEELVRLHGLEAVLAAIERINGWSGLPGYKPLVYSPHQLNKKWGEVERFNPNTHKKPVFGSSVHI